MFSEASGYSNIPLISLKVSESKRLEAVSEWSYNAGNGALWAMSEILSSHFIAGATPLFSQHRLKSHIIKQWIKERIPGLG
jgi:hypothetical protein